MKTPKPLILRGAVSTPSSLRRCFRTVLFLAMTATPALGLGGCSDYDEAAWAAFIGCLFYGDEYACYGGPFYDLAFTSPSGATADPAELELSLDELRLSLYEEFSAYRRMQAAAAATGRAAPSPAAFVASRHPGWEARREVIRTFLERELGPHWMRRLPPPGAAGGAHSPMEPL